MTPTVGRTVLFRSNDASLSGAEPDREVPAIITRVWSETCVNLMVMRDGPGATPQCVTSVTLEQAPSRFERYHASWRWMPTQLSPPPLSPHQIGGVNAASVQGELSMANMPSEVRQALADRP